MSVAFDADTGKIWYAKNGTFLGSGDPAAGSNEVHTVTAGDLAKGMLPVFSGYHTGGTPVINFGQDSSFVGNETAQGNADGNGIGDFYYAPPSGYLALCTANLPDPVAAVDPAKGGSPQDYFNTVLYTGNDTSGRAITGVGFQPDFVWIKNRAATYYHNLSDTVRGITRSLSSNATDAEVNFSNISAVGSDGFTISGAELVNKNAQAIVAWSWKAGTAFSNDASATSVGNVDSTGSVNADVGFSIIAKTNTGNDNQTVAHGLGVAPDLIIIKNRSTTGSWVLGYNTAGFNWANDYIQFDTGVEKGDGSGTVFGATPTSTVFTTGSGINGTDGVTQIAYCFASVDGFSKIGSYTGNGNADGPFVYTGFRPAWVMHKRIDGTGQWAILDNTRSPFNVANKHLYADGSNAEVTNTSFNLDYLSNGFKVRSTNTYTNASGGTYIYMAFAEQPFKYANAR